MTQQLDIDGVTLTVNAAGVLLQDGFSSASRSALLTRLGLGIGLLPITLLSCASVSS